MAEQLVSGREDIFFGYEFETRAGDWDVTMSQNAERAKETLTMPVLKPPRSSSRC